MRVLKAIPAALLLLTVAAAAPGSVGTERDSQFRGAQGRHDRRLESDDDEGSGHQRLHRIRHRRHDRARKGSRSGGRVVATDWKALVSGVTSGKYHMTGSASISPARAKAAGYSTSYFSLATVPLILAEDKDRFMAGRSDQPEVVVAATLGTVQEKLREALLPERPAQDRRGAGARLPGSARRAGRCPHHVKRRRQTSSFRNIRR